MAVESSDVVAFMFFFTSPTDPSWDIRTLI